MGTIDLKSIDKEALKEAARITLAQKSSAYFAETVLRDISSAKTIKEHIMHLEWHRAANDAKKHGCGAVIIAHRDGGKTLNISVGLPLFWQGEDPNRQGKIVSNNDDNAIKRLDAVKQYIKEDLTYRKVFPKTKPKQGGVWDKTQIQLERHVISHDISIEASGILSSATGGRANWIIFDDVCDHRNTLIQPSSRKTVRHTFFNVWLNLLERNPENPPWWVYIATFWHDEDLSHQLVRNKHNIVLMQWISEDFKSIEQAYYSPYEEDYEGYRKQMEKYGVLP